MGKIRKEKEETDVREFAIFDEKDSISNLEELSAAMGGTLSWKECESADQVRELVKKDQVEGGFLVEDLLHYTYVVENNSMTDSTDGAFAQALASMYRTQYLEEKGIDAEEISQLYQVTPESQMEILGKNSVKNYAYTYMLVMVLYFLLIFYGQMISVSITTEKSNRAIEILVTSVNSNSLIFGKVLAGAVAGIIQCTLILGSAGGVPDVPGELELPAGFSASYPGERVGCFVILGLLGYLLPEWYFLRDAGRAGFQNGGYQ